MATIRIGTRGSELARAQAGTVLCQCGRELNGMTLTQPLHDLGFQRFKNQ